MSKFIDITGQRFGRLTVIERDGSYYNYTNKHRTIPMWRCKCDCGNETVVLATNLKTGATKSCGCLRRERAGRMRKSV